MVKPRIVSIELQNGWDLESHPPANPERFECVVRALAGPDPGEGEESFDFRVCSLQSIGEEIDQNGFSQVATSIVVQHWAPALIRIAVSKCISKYSGETWDELVSKLARIAIWEFEV